MQCFVISLLFLVNFPSRASLYQLENEQCDLDGTLVLWTFLTLRLDVIIHHLLACDPDTDKRGGDATYTVQSPSCTSEGLVGTDQWRTWKRSLKVSQRNTTLESSGIFKRKSEILKAQHYSFVIFLVVMTLVHLVKSLVISWWGKSEKH